MKKFLLILCSILLLSGLIISGCAEPEAAPAPAPAPKPEPKPAPAPAPGPKAPKEILIGDTVSFTGKYAGFGQGHFGAEAAVEDINKLGGVYVEEYDTKIPVRYIALDTGSDMLKVAPLAEDLVLTEKVHFLGTTLDPPEMRLGMADVADKYGIPAVPGVGPFESWMSIKEGAGAEWKYTWAYGFAIATPTAPGDFREGNPGYSMMATYFGALEEFGAATNKKIAVAALDDLDGNAWYSGFTDYATGIGYDPYRTEDRFGIFPGDVTDFTPVIEDWKDYGCEMLWCNSPGFHFGILWKQCHVLGFQPKAVFSTRGALFFRDVEAWGGDLPHAVGMETFWDPSIQNAPGIGDTTPRSLEQRWLDATGEPLNQSIGWSYMGMQVIFDAIERAGTLDGAAVVAALDETDLNTMWGRVVFEEGTQFQRIPTQFGQWVKTDNPWVWEYNVVLSFNDFLPATAEFIFPMPYD